MNPAGWLLTELTAAFGLSAEALIVCGLLLAAVVLFVSEVLPVDLVALSILAALLLTGLLTPAEGLSGFSHIATVTIGAMFVLSEGVRRTGALNAVGDQTNTLEYGSGAPLNVIFWILGTILIPVIWPL